MKSKIVIVLIMMVIGFPIVFSQIAIPGPIETEADYKAPDAIEQISKTPYTKTIQVQYYDEILNKTDTYEKIIYEYKTDKDGIQTTVKLSDKLAAKEITQKEALEKTRWGFGCPHRCGRFWEFKPYGNTWIPADPLYENYLRNYTNIDGVISFICDRDGEVITIDTK